jgi:hypothetical protein
LDVRGCLWGDFSDMIDSGYFDTYPPLPTPSLRFQDPLPLALVVFFCFIQPLLMQQQLLLHSMVVGSENLLL